MRQATSTAGQGISKSMLIVGPPNTQQFSQHCMCTGLASVVINAPSKMKGVMHCFVYTLVPPQQCGTIRSDASFLPLSFFSDNNYCNEPTRSDEKDS